MALAINPTLSVDPVLSRPLPSSPTLQPVKHLVLCYRHRPCAEASPPLHLLFPPSRGEKKRLSFLILRANSCLFQEIPPRFTPPGSPFSPHVSVCRCGILQTEFCKDTWSILTPLEAGNLRPSQRLAAISRAQYWCVCGGGAGCLHGIIYSPVPSPRHGTISWGWLGPCSFGVSSMILFLPAD